MTTDTAQGLPRYKIGYTADEWGMNRSLGLIPDANGSVVRHSDALAAIQAAQAAQPERKALSDAEFDLRGLLASKLTCWHRLTAAEVDNLLLFAQSYGIHPAGKEAEQ